MILDYIGVFFYLNHFDDVSKNLNLDISGTKGWSLVSKVIAAVMIDMSSFSYEYIYNRIVADEIPILLTM